MANYIQGDKLTEIVIPLLVTPFDKSSEVLSPPRELVGTGFLIGANGFALTAAHVIDQLIETRKDNEVLSTHLLDGNGLHPFLIVDHEKHPTEDVGILRLENHNLKSFLAISNKRYLHSTPYIAWGYPRETAEELLFIRENADLFPDIIFIEGYIRRVIHHELRLTIFKGNRFYEVSDLGGPGYSGSPVIAKNSLNMNLWEVLGIYIGEKDGLIAPVGYVVPSRNFFDWKPNILGCTIIEESNRGNTNLFDKK